MKVRKVLALVALLSGLATFTASATVGGEKRVQLLGWDKAVGRVYFHELGSGEDEDGRVIFLSVVGSDAGAIGVLPWKRGEVWSDADKSPEALLDSLRAALRPLRVSRKPTTPISSQVVQADSVPNPYGLSDRLRVRVSFGGDLAFEVTTWGSTTVTRPAVFEIPGRSEQVWVLAFVGDPFETGYETQLPVLVRRGERGTRRIEWSSSE